MAQGFDIWDKVRQQTRPGGSGAPEEQNEMLRQRLIALANGSPQPQEMQPEEMGGEGGEASMQEFGLPPSPIPRGMEQQGPTAPRRRDAPRRPPAPYETPDNPDANDFLRRRATTGPAPDDPFPQAWEDPKEFERIRRGAYQAGATGDDASILQILNGPYRDTPLGREMWKAYQQGKADRGRGRR